MTAGVKTDFSLYKRPKNYFRAKLYDFVSLGSFDAFIMVCIILNILTMAMAYEGSTS